MNIPKVHMSDGQTIPQFGFGSAGIAPEESASMIEQVIDAGYPMIDTANKYRNQKEVGDGLASRKLAAKELYLTSKVWPTQYGYDNVLAAFDQSLAELKQERLDLYLLHWPAPQLGLYVESWKALIELQAAGRVTSIGVSNFYPDQIQRLIDETGVAPVCNQFELHPYRQRDTERSFHKKMGITTVAWSPLARARCLHESILVETAQAHQKTPAQVVIRYLLQLDAVVIPRSGNPIRMVENLDVFDFSLTALEMAAIAALNRGPEGRLEPEPTTWV